MRVQLGCERLLASSALDGKRVGVVCNPASVDSQLRHVADLFAERPAMTLAALFGPQHGFRSDVQDNMIETGHGQDCTRRVPVYSLYSETREPTAAMLAGLDAIVCDRPNPIGGADVEGPVLVRGYESFVGQYPIPMRHGMTIGELALLFNTEFGIGANLEVIRMEGWRREMYFDETRLPWVIPSPNMPTLDTAIVYPGTVLFEGTNVSEGRGTTRPFEIVGAPWPVAERFAEAMNRTGLPGVYFRPVVFEPTFQKHAKTACAGCQIHVLDRRTFKPVETGVALIAAFRAVGPDTFAWRN